MRLYLSIVLFLILSIVCTAALGRSALDLNIIETFIIEPTVIENMSVWVPAAKSGPFINRSCRVKQNLVFSSILLASIKHQKTTHCPDQIAKILAELTAFYHSRSLPLTIFNGWQWEYTYSMSQYESVSYDLAQRGGCWENCWEAVLNLTCGASRRRIIELESFEKFAVKKTLPTESTIEVKTFSSMRTRYGYPKERQL